MIPGRRLFIFEFKIGPFDINRYVFYSSKSTLTREDFKNALKSTIATLQKKYNRKNPYDLIKIRAFHNDLLLNLKRKGFYPITDYNYVDFNEIIK